MVERICPTCSHGNPLDDKFCGKCGASLERLLPVRAGESRLALAGRQLPVTWRQLGKTVAISAVALAAEAGIAWLSRRAASPAASSQLLSKPLSVSREVSTERTGSMVTIISKRVLEMWEDPNGKRQVVEQNFWRRIDE